MTILPTEFLDKQKRFTGANEGYREFPYPDNGNVSVGYGRNLSQRGISPQEADILLQNDIEYFYLKLSYVVSFFDSLDDIRKMGLIDMCFNLGLHGFLTFENMLHSIANGNMEGAANEVLNSKAAKQNPIRYQKIADIIRTGVL